jgi:hypothetical protein
MQSTGGCGDRERERKRGERREKAKWDISAIASAVAYWLFSLLQD